jgi:hypothetical protein
VYLYGRFFHFVISKIFENIDREPIFINKFLEKVSNWLNNIIKKVSPPLYALVLHLLYYRFKYYIWADDTYATGEFYMHPPN